MLGSLLGGAGGGMPAMGGVGMPAGASATSGDIRTEFVPSANIINPPGEQRMIDLNILFPGATLDEDKVNAFVPPDVKGLAPYAFFFGLLAFVLFLTRKG